MSIRIVAPTIVRFTAKHHQTDGRPADCVVDISVDELAISRETAVLDAASHFSAIWQDFVTSQTSNTLTYDGAHYIDLDSLTGITGLVGPAGGHATVGVLTSSAASPQVSYLVKKACSANRSQRAGRMYVPAPQELEIDNNGVLTTARQNAFNTALSTLRSALNGIGGLTQPISTAWRVVHIDRHGFDNPADSEHWTWNSTDVTNAVVDAIVATQRRRLRG